MTIKLRENRGDTKVDMDHYFSELIDILKHEIRSFNTIVELLILEQKGLVECNNVLLLEVLERQEDVFSSIACLEKSRIEIIKKIADTIGEDPDELTISRLSEIAGEDIKKELLETAHVLSTINEDIRHKRISNSMLINQGIMIVESQIRFILKAMGKEDLIKEIYSPDANNGQIFGCIRVDNRM